MNPEQWSAVDSYLSGLMIPKDAMLEEALRSSGEAGLPPINVSPVQGKFLMLLARLCKARSVLEIGTLGGYSTIWLARGLAAGGRVVTLEAEPKHADVARGNLTRAGLSGVVEIRLGPALESLPRLAAEGVAPFDLVFVDADKPNNPAYYEWAVRLSRPGSLIVIDNVIRDGAIADPASTDPRVTRTREMFERIAADPRVSATALQTVGSKGYDGFAVVLVVDPLGQAGQASSG